MFFLGSIQTVMFGQVLPLTSTTQSFCAGEHVIVAWCDRSYTWELGVVEKCQSANIVVSHMVPTNQENTCWVFPEEAVTLCVKNDQVLLRRVMVHYHQSMCIRSMCVSLFTIALLICTVLKQVFRFV